VDHEVGTESQQVNCVTSEAPEVAIVEPKARDVDHEVGTESQQVNCVTSEPTSEPTSETNQSTA